MGRLAQLCFRHTVLPGLAHCFESSCSSSKQRVPAHVDFALRSRSLNACMRRDGGGSPRLASPGREQLFVQTCVSDGGVTRIRSIWYPGDDAERVTVRPLVVPKVMH